MYVDSCEEWLKCTLKCLWRLTFSSRWQEVRRFCLTSKFAECDDGETAAQTASIVHDQSSSLSSVLFLLQTRERLMKTCVKADSCLKMRFDCVIFRLWLSNRSSHWKERNINRRTEWSSLFGLQKKERIWVYEPIVHCESKRILFSIFSRSDDHTQNSCQIQDKNFWIQSFQCSSYIRFWVLVFRFILSLVVSVNHVPALRLPQKKQKIFEKLLYASLTKSTLKTISLWNLK